MLQVTFGTTSCRRKEKMTVIDQFRMVVLRETAENPKKALPLSDYVTLMGKQFANHRTSVRAQLTRAMKSDGPLRDLVEKGLVFADVANRQPECFADVERKPATLPVVVTDGPVADLRTFPEENLTEEAKEAKHELVETLTVVKMPVRHAEKTARDVSKILFEVEREKLKKDAAERSVTMLEKHIQRLEGMYEVLAQAVGTRREAAE
jgi:hypothetical protein